MVVEAPRQKGYEILKVPKLFYTLQHGIIPFLHEK
tara:strand:+ start:20692 stop:20796 length:105 start_codon:yes stop_codon:yes gene_type:complete